MRERNVIIFIGLMNLSLLGFLTPLLNGELLAATDPLFFSWSGVLLIALWGLAYIAVAPIWDKAPWLLLVFAVEKLVFDLRWVHWLTNYGEQSLAALYQQDVMVALFYSGYGIWDGACALVFFWYFLRARKLQKG